MIEDNEAIYDEQVYPLMAQVIEICQKNNIPFLASFQLTGGPRNDEEEAALLCSSAHLPPAKEGTEECLHRAYSAIFNRASASMMALTVTTTKT